MQINLGKSFNNPIVLKKVEVDKSTEKFFIETDKTLSNKYKSLDKIQNVLDYIFGSDDGNWFMINESTLFLDNFKYVVYYIEDKDGDKHQIYIKII